ncbi:MAG: glycosyltransferase 87 family protein, partial [bacterium]|nr:glycosyltransferase 87 family protein [bacterium]
ILSGDLRGTYYPLAQTHLPGISIYPPGASLFFMLFPTGSLDLYQWSFVTINCLFLLIIARLTKRPNMLALIILAAGPILLFRFDLLVMLLVVLSIVTFRRNNFWLSGMFLGFATITKLFPVILIPYFLLVLFFNNRQKIIPWFLAYFVSIVSIFVFYVLFTGFDWLDVVLRSGGAFGVSVHVESVIATVLTLVTAITNPGSHGLEFKEALWALNPLYFLGHARIFKLISPVIITLVYGFILFQKKTFAITKCLLIILTLLITSQLLSPQYVIWPAMLILLEEKINKINIILLLLALVLTQIIYPLNYGEFLDFYNKGINLHLFLIMTARNLILVILTMRLLVQVWCTHRL